MFALTLKGGTCMSTIPDVCKTPAPNGATPLPYVNIFQCNMVLPNTASTKVLIDGSPAITIKSKTTLSNGDEPGVTGGIVSGKFIQKGEFLLGSFKVSFQGKSAVRQGAMTKHNSGNTTGINSMAAQAKVTVS